MSYLLKGYMDNVISSMIAARYAEKAVEPDCPYLQANAGDGSYLISSTKDAFTLTGVAKPGKIKEAYAAVPVSYTHLDVYKRQVVDGALIVLLEYLYMEDILANEYFVG